MRVYHRLIHIRDQKERHEDIPEHITSHPVFKLTTEFRLHVQKHSAPISKVSKLVVTAEGMQIFAQLAGVLNEQGSTVMVYLVACILERLFGKDTIDDIESIRGDLTIPQIIDGVSTSHIEEAYVDSSQGTQDNGEEEEGMDDGFEDGEDGFDDGFDDGFEVAEEVQVQPAAPTPTKASTTQWLSSNFVTQPSVQSTSGASMTTPTPAASNAFAGLVSQPNVFGTKNVFGTNNVFGGPSFSTSAATQSAPASMFAPSGSTSQSVFGGPTFTNTSNPVPISTVSSITPAPFSNGVASSSEQSTPPSFALPPPTSGFGVSFVVILSSILLIL